MLRQIEPAKCRGKLREAMWDDPEWVAEFKFDGTRYLMHTNRRGSRFTSRRQSVNGTGFVEKRNFPHLETITWGDTVLDGEMVLSLFGSSYESAQITGSSREVAIHKQVELGPIHYFAFDVLYLSGVDMRYLFYTERKKRLEEYLLSIANPYVHYVKHYAENKRRLYNSIVQRGGEGIVLKYIHSQYGERSKWVKVKKQETWDVIITGYLDPSVESEKVDGTISVTRYKEKGWIGSICIGQKHKAGMLDCGSVSGMDELTRAMISKEPERYVGLVIEIEAQERLPSGRFRHPRFIRFRLDKDAKECIYAE